MLNYHNSLLHCQHICIFWHIFLHQTTVQQRHSGFLLSLSSFGRPVIRSLSSEATFVWGKQRQAQCTVVRSTRQQAWRQAERRRLSAAAAPVTGAPAGAAESRSLSAYTHSPLPFLLSSLIWLGRLRTTVHCACLCKISKFRLKNNRPFFC